MWFLIVLVALALLVLLFVGWRLRRRRIPAGVRARLQADFQRAAMLPDPYRRILEAENVVDQALQKLGYSGTFSEKLERAGPRLRDKESLWRAHKLRNRIAHEVGVRVDEGEAGAAVSAFKRALQDL